MQMVWSGLVEFAIEQRGCGVWLATGRQDKTRRDVNLEGKRHCQDCVVQMAEMAG